MTAIRENGGALLAAFDYDQLGRRERLTLGNGAVTAYEYDGASRLWKLKHDLTGTGHDNEIAFASNAAGQIVERQASNLAYAWTGHGDGTTTYDVDGLNRLTSKTTGPTVTTYVHDKRGDRLNDDNRSYAYDSETKGLGAPSAPWHHDPLGRLSGASTSAGTPPAIVYESYVDNLVAERTPGSSTVQRRHVFGPGTDEPLVWYEGPSRRFLHADERGSIVAVTAMRAPCSRSTATTNMAAPRRPAPPIWAGSSTPASAGSAGWGSTTRRVETLARPARIDSGRRGLQSPASVRRNCLPN